MAYCPKCQRPFEDGGEFCPFDGTGLAAGPGPLGGTTGDHEGARARAGESGVVAVSARDSGSGAFADPSRRSSAVYRGLIGKTLDGRYRIESVLGEGGMGIVFLAKHVVIEKTVAVKVLKKDASQKENVATRFLREAKAASRIGHPNIIDVTDFGTTSAGITYSVMEYVEGQTLAKVIAKDAPIGADRVLAIAAQMARALDAAHGKGVVHRDLKPENVFLVDRDGRRDFVKIVDFGIARVLPVAGGPEAARLTRVGTVFGTPEYMAPEQASGRADIDHRVDIYALGTIMYEMLSGSVPHRGDTTVRTLAMQMLDVIVPLSALPITASIDREVEALVMKALAKKREERWSTMALMLRSILALTDDAQTLRESSSHLAAVSTILEGPQTELDEAPLGARVTDDGVTSEHLPGRIASIAPTDIYQVLTPKGEPAFVKRRRRPSIDDLVDPPPDARPKPSRAWIGAVALATLALVVVGGVLFAAGDRRRRAEIELDGGTSSRVASALDSGAAVVVAPAADAGPADARGSSTKTNGKSVANAGRSDGGVIELGPEVDVEVVTRPEGGKLWDGNSYAGSGGVIIRRPSGTALRLRCTKDGYRSAHVMVRFAADNPVVACVMKKKAKCVADLKNPYAECP